VLHPYHHKSAACCRAGLRLYADYKSATRS
jgi:hypothetical protein